jgi:phosphopantothenoylcysteine decarboxylase/phosphopantothenate--cysteine ligase
MSENASHFVTATTLQAVSGNPVRDTLWDEYAEAAMGHIELARWADQIVIAPATANCIARLAQGKADDLLTTLCLATQAPISVAPSMNQQMYKHPATRSNLAKLAGYNYRIIGPDHGDQACGDDGAGRMSEPDAIIEAIITQQDLPSANKEQWFGLRVLITTGPTQESIDPVRYISNHSSGLQGLSLANAALARGANVSVVAGPGVPECDPSISRVNVKTALEMHDAVHECLTEVDVFIGVAAVADYRVRAVKDRKIKRNENEDANLSLVLVENPDIIASVAASKSAALVIGFAAETHDSLEYARSKLSRKGLDAIIVNDVSDHNIGFNSQDNEVTFIHKNGETTYPRQSKGQIAERLLDEIISVFSAQLAKQ